MALTSGTRLGPYAITAQIGVGGMGEVYRARDTKLKREVGGAAGASACSPKTPWIVCCGTTPSAACACPSGGPDERAETEGGEEG